MRNSIHKFGLFTLFALSLAFCSSTAFGQATIQRPIEDFINAQTGWFSWSEPATGNDQLDRFYAELSQTKQPTRD
jgi:hypothetical protein